MSNPKSHVLRALLRLANGKPSGLTTREESTFYALGWVDKSGKITQEGVEMLHSRASESSPAIADENTPESGVNGYTWSDGTSYRVQWENGEAEVLTPHVPGDSDVVLARGRSRRELWAQLDKRVPTDLADNLLLLLPAEWGVGGEEVAKETQESWRIVLPGATSVVDRFGAVYGVRVVDGCAEVTRSSKGAPFVVLGKSATRDGIRKQVAPHVDAETLEAVLLLLPADWGVETAPKELVFSAFPAALAKVLRDVVPPGGVAWRGDWGVHTVETVASAVEECTPLGEEFLHDLLRAAQRVLVDSQSVDASTTEEVFRVDAVARESLDPLTKQRVFGPPVSERLPPSQMKVEKLWEEVAEHRAASGALKTLWGVIGVQPGETLLAAAKRVVGERDSLRVRIQNAINGMEAFGISHQCQLWTAIDRYVTACGGDVGGEVSAPHRVQAKRAVTGVVASMLKNNVAVVSDKRRTRTAPGDTAVADVLTVREGSVFAKAGYAPTTPMAAGDTVKLAERVMRCWAAQTATVTALLSLLDLPVAPESLRKLVERVTFLAHNDARAREHFRAKPGEQLTDAIRRSYLEDLGGVRLVRCLMGAMEGEPLEDAVARYAMRCEAQENDAVAELGRCRVAMGYPATKNDITEDTDVLVARMMKDRGSLVGRLLKAEERIQEALNAVRRE